MFNVTRTASEAIRSGTLILPAGKAIPLILQMHVKSLLTWFSTLIGFYLEINCAPDEAWLAAPSMITTSCLLMRVVQLFAYALST